MQSVGNVVRKQQSYLLEKLRAGMESEKMADLTKSGKPKDWRENNMLLEHLSPLDEARRFCHLAGWHHDGDTRVMFVNGGYIELPEALVDFAAHLIAERDAWRKIAEELQMVTIKPGGMQV